MYYLVLVLSYGIAILPFPLIYLLSDIINFVMFKVIGYRKKVLWDNVSKAFPDKSSAEQQQIIKDFQRGFCDHWLETIKLLTISKATLQKRITGNWEVLNEMSQKNNAVYAMLGHRFNWEWANVAGQINTNAQFACLYLPLSSKAVDRLMMKIRTRMGTIMVPASDMRPHLKQLANQQHILGFAADQTPANLKIAIWYDFLNQPAPFVTGPEKAAKLARAAIVYTAIYQVKRGYYRVELTPITENARETEPEYITDTFVSMLKEEMYKQPHNWLWTHRRWKRTPLPENIIKHV